MVQGKSHIYLEFGSMRRGKHAWTSRRQHLRLQLCGARSLLVEQPLAYVGPPRREGLRTAAHEMLGRSYDHVTCASVAMI